MTEGELELHRDEHFLLSNDTRNELLDLQEALEGVASLIGCRGPGISPEVTCDGLTALFRVFSQRCRDIVKPLPHSFGVRH